MIDSGIFLYKSLRSFILPLEKINNFLPKHGRIIDLGCGQGIIASYLAKERGRIVIGVDSNIQRLPLSDSKNLKFVNADLRTFNTRGASAVLLSDVLHHMNFQDQIEVLKKIAKSFGEGSVLVIKEVDAAEFLRSKISRFWDYVFYPKEKIYYSPSTELKQKLMSLNFKVKIVKTSRFFPGSTTLLICTKCKKD